MTPRGTHARATVAPRTDGSLALKIEVQLEGPAAVRELLAQRGLSITDVADLLDVSRQHVSGVINGYWPNRRIETFIAQLLNRSRETLFTPRSLSGDRLARTEKGVNDRVREFRGQRRRTR